MASQPRDWFWDSRTQERKRKHFLKLNTKTKRYCRKINRGYKRKNKMKQMRILKDKRENTSNGRQARIYMQ